MYVSKSLEKVEQALPWKKKLNYERKTKRPTEAHTTFYITLKGFSKMEYIYRMLSGVHINSQLAVENLEVPNL